ncbi:Dysferlin [Hamiltosporidium tvaerminnensis]|nr:Dysferlin [Hamiltosporidium tvaerminnensis]
MTELLSQQLNLEYKAFYIYSACNAYFDRSDVALQGLSKYFKKMYKEELTHAKGIIEYMNKNDINIEFKNIQIDDLKIKFENLDVVSIFEKCIEFEKAVQKNILEMYKYAEENDDYSLCVFLDPYVAEQVDSIKELKDHLKNAIRCKDNLGVYIFDQSFL